MCSLAWSRRNRSSLSQCLIRAPASLLDPALHFKKFTLAIPDFPFQSRLTQRDTLRSFPRTPPLFEHQLHAAALSRRSCLSQPMHTPFDISLAQALASVNEVLHLILLLRQKYTLPTVAQVPGLRPWIPAGGKIPLHPLFAQSQRWLWLPPSAAVRSLRAAICVSWFHQWLRPHLGNPPSVLITRRDTPCP